MRLSKKIISALISVVLILSVAIPAFAAVDENAVCPLIYVPGVDASKIYADKNDPDSVMQLVDKDKLIAMLQNDIAPALVVYSADRDIDALAHKVTGALNEIYGCWFNNPDGTAQGNGGAVMKYPAASSVKKNSEFTFSYDWRGDPMTAASELKAFIDYVTENSGCEKVALAGHSLGNIVILSYLSLYGDSDVMGIVFDTSTIDGVEYIGELLCGEMEINGDSVTAFLKSVLGENGYKDLIKSSLDIFDMAGIPEMLAVFLDDILKKIGPTIFKETLIPMFAYWPSVWAMTTDAQLDEAMDYIFGVVHKDEDMSALTAKLEAYNETVRKNKKATLTAFDENGRVAVISRYGFSYLPITGNSKLISDTVVETKTSSFGATTADAGDYFSDEYLKGKDMKYISPDKTVDASTAMFAGKTWFIKNIFHNESEETRVLHKTLLFAAEEADRDNSDLPGFMYYNRDTGEFVADETAPEKVKKTTPLEKLFNFLKALIDKIVDFFTKKK